MWDDMAHLLDGHLCERQLPFDVELWLGMLTRNVTSLECLRQCLPPVTPLYAQLLLSVASWMGDLGI